MVGIDSAFQIAGSLIAYNAQRQSLKQAQAAQVQAIQQQQQNILNNMDPETVNQLASDAAVKQATASLALQKQIDPGLAALRGQAETGMQGLLTQINDPNSNPNKVAGAATNEALAAGPGAEASKNSLIDAALQQLKLGATLPPDVQNELVQAGLERGGQSTQHASGQGTGGTLLRTILGTAGVNLQMQRQTQAAQLLGQAQQISQSRSAILGSLFPNLTQQQLGGLSANAGALGTSNALMPTVGLSGTDTANLWLQRTGALNNLIANRGNVDSSSALGMGQLKANTIGQVSKAAGDLVSSAVGGLGGGMGGGAAGGASTGLNLDGGGGGGSGSWLQSLLGGMK